MKNEQTNALIEKIRSGKYSDQELINLYNNASKLGKTDVMDAVKIQLRIDFPRAANRKFGAKENEAEALLADVYSKISGLYKLDGNYVKNGVKAGGEMIAGNKYIEVYISFKNKTGFGVFLGLSQDAPDSELMARVGNYKTGDDSFRDEQTYKMHDFNQAVEHYKLQLSGVLPTV